ncbi:archaetidylserine decarboxylase [Inmirania thermothiophila]|uniref:Phosphatidylserine decarboxylase proenzyme n=1 Tax=Inmirania thermothiophila TaxID=1750597 RepID=A0A3N1Y2J6_9GAMM|nr:archaetidylserine decarboxylase [Inmirania thermothiophila]ROR32761.1 phosphatidylserine decarboxylase [Inmirania thermothiophila]
MTAPAARLGAILQHLAPQHALTRIAGRLARAEAGPLTTAAIRAFVRAYGVDLAEAERTRAEDYATFDAFFTRRLRAGARPQDPDPRAVTSPVDGTVSQLGPVVAGRILQAKGRWYTAAELLADPARALPFRDGTFFTLYLSPRDYHRIHMPLDAEVRESVYVPGRLFSVGDGTAAAVPRLFARNERLVTMLETALGPVALVMVGAMVVGGMETPWTGPATPPHGGGLRLWQPQPRPRLARGDEAGCFHVGSTVILLFPRGAVVPALDLAPGSPVRVGRRIATARV